jgi:rod shape-determining protein MreC
VAQTRGRQRLLTLSAFVLASLTLLVIGGPLRRVASSGARGIVSPFVAVVRGVTNPVGDTVASWFNYDSVVAQNHQLERQLGELRMQAAEVGYQQRELAELLALQRLPFVDSLPTVTAATTNQNLSNFSATIEVDKGTDAGVLAGMPVVGAGGLVGVVTSVTSGGATVTLLTDTTQSIGVTFGTGYDAVVHGQGAGNELSANLVAPGTPVHKGEILYTDGLRGGLFPAGIPVGTLQRTSGAARGSGQESASVTPLANLNQLAYVDVVLWEPGT